MEKTNLNEIYQRVAEEISPSDRYRKFTRECKKKKEELLKMIGEEYKKELEEISEINYIANAELNKQFFYEGFSKAVKLFVEAMNK